MTILTQAELDDYKREIKYRLSVNAAMMPVALNDLAQMIAEIEASRLKVEQLSEKCSQLREA